MVACYMEIFTFTTILKRNICSYISDRDVQIAVGKRVEPPQNCYIAQINVHSRIVGDRRGCVQSDLNEKTVSRR
jgi:hypothetical protein